MNEFFMKRNYEYLLEQMGENGSETKVVRELERKKNGTYFCGKIRTLDLWDGKRCGAASVVRLPISFSERISNR
jgi:hypothetical protein